MHVNVDFKKQWAKKFEWMLNISYLEIREGNIPQRLWDQMVLIALEEHWDDKTIPVKLDDLFTQASPIF